MRNIRRGALHFFGAACRAPILHHLDQGEDQNIGQIASESISLLSLLVSHLRNQFDEAMG